MIDEKKLIEDIEKDRTAFRSELYTDDSIREYFIGAVEDQPKIEKCGDCSRRKFYQMGYEDASNKWIPFEIRETDEEEKTFYRFSYIMCGKLPEDGEEILVTYSNGYVGADTFVWDGCNCYLDSGLELVEEAIAWMPKPKPYKQENK